MHLFGPNRDHDYYFELPREGENFVICCGANRRSTRAMTPAKHHSATSPVDIRPSGIAHTTALISERLCDELIPLD